VRCTTRPNLSILTIMSMSMLDYLGLSCTVLTMLQLLGYAARSGGGESE